MFRFHVPGMTCGGCARSVTAAIKSVDASAQIETDLASKIIRAESRANSATLAAAIRDAGYDCAPL